MGCREEKLALDKLSQPVPYGGIATSLPVTAFIFCHLSGVFGH
jgi:hypothetical protein